MLHNIYISRINILKSCHVVLNFMFLDFSTQPDVTPSLKKKTNIELHEKKCIV
jgi:hypothetical protein